MPSFLRTHLTVLAALSATTTLAQAQEDYYLLDEFVITPNRVPTAEAKTGASVSVLDEAEIEADDRPFVLQQLTTLPGVTISQNGPPGTTSGFAIRGAPQQYVRVYVDGIEISDPTSPQVSPALEGLVTDGISRMEVLRGSQSALYGGQAVAGVIDISTFTATEDGFQGRYTLEGGSYDTWRSNLGIAGRDARGEFALDISHYQTNGFSALDENDGFDEADGYDTTRISGSGRLNASEAVTLFASAFWQEESGDIDGWTFDPDLGYFVPGDTADTYETRQWGARMGADIAAPGSRLAHQLAVSYFAVERDIDDGTGYNTEGDRVNVEYLGNLDWSEVLGFQFGADYSKESTEPGEAAKEDSSIAGLFGQADWSPVDALTLTAALRQDQHSEFGGYTSGRLTAAYDLPTETLLRASLGNGFRPPSNYELFDPIYGNSDLDPETSVSADLGVEQGFAGGRGAASATLFWLEIDDLIEWVETDPTTFSGQYQQTDGTSESKGLELATTWAITETLDLTGSYTYTDAKTPEGERQSRIPRHDLSLTLSGAAKRLSYALEARYLGDYVDTATTATGNFHTDFTVVNARLGYALTEQAELYVRAENLFDTEYQTARGYGTSDQAFYMGLRGTF